MTKDCDVTLHHVENYLGNCGEECILEEIQNAQTKEDKQNAIRAYNQWRKRNRAKAR